MSTDAIEYRSLLVDAVGPTRLGDSIKAALARVARRTGLSDRRVRAIWNGEITDLRGRELLALLRAAREQKAVEAAQHEYRTLEARLSAIEATLGLPPAELAGEAAAQRGGASGPLASGE